MKNNWFMRSLVLVLIFSLGSVQAQDLASLLEKLSKEYHFTYKEMKTDTFFVEKYLLKIEQEVNQENPNGQTFTQRVFLSHRGMEKPVVFITEGYAANYAENSYYLHELSSFLDANQICVEHRYFGESIPDSLDWSNLTVYNSATDHHRIVEILKKIYY